MFEDAIISLTTEDIEAEPDMEYKILYHTEKPNQWGGKSYVLTLKRSDGEKREVYMSQKQFEPFVRFIRKNDLRVYDDVVMTFAQEGYINKENKPAMRVVFSKLWIRTQSKLQ